MCSTYSYRSWGPFFNITFSWFPYDLKAACPFVYKTHFTIISLIAVYFVFKNFMICDITKSNSDTFPYQWVNLNCGSYFLAKKNMDFVSYFCFCVNAGKIKPRMWGSHSNGGPIKMLVLEQNCFLININLLLLCISRAHREIKILLHPLKVWLSVCFLLFVSSS